MFSDLKITINKINIITKKNPYICDVSLHDQDKSEYSTAILLNLKSEVTGIVNDLCLPNVAVGELLLSATYLAAWKGR